MGTAKKALALFLALILAVGLFASAKPLTVQAAPGPIAMDAITITGDPAVLQIKFSKPVYYDNYGSFAGLRIVENMTNQNLTFSYSTHIANDYLQIGAPLVAVTSGAGVTTEEKDGKTYSDTYTWTNPLGTPVAEWYAAVKEGGAYEGRVLAFCMEEAGDTVVDSLKDIYDSDGAHLMPTKPALDGSGVNTGAWEGYYFKLAETGTSRITLDNVALIDDYTYALKFSECPGNMPGYGFYLRAVKADGTLINEWTLSAGYIGGVMYGMSASFTGGASYSASVKPVLDANAGSKLVFSVEDPVHGNYYDADGDVNCLWAYYSHSTPWAWAADHKFLKATGTRNRGAGNADIAECEVASPANNLTLESAYVNAADHSQIVLTFSEPIGNYGGYSIRIYPQDSNGDNIINPACSAGTYWDVRDVAYYGSGGNQLVGTIFVPGSSDHQDYQAVVDFCASQGWNTPRLALWENDGYYTHLHNMSRNGLIENFTGLYTGTHLLADKAGEFDIAFTDITITDIGEAPEALSAVRISDTQARIVFNSAVGLNDLSKITSGGANCLSAAAANGSQSDTSWIVTFPASTLTDSSTITLAADAFRSEIGTPTAAAVLSFDYWTDAVDYGEQQTLDLTKPFSFMNCDTGREISVGDVSEFTLEKDASHNNLYALKSGDKYLDLTSGAAPALSTNKQLYLIKEIANDRYQVIAFGSYPVSDTNAGATTTPSLALASAGSNAIQTGWYLTPSGDTKPLRVMPIGDSITWGVNPETGDPHYGYRAELSTELNDYFGRVVFVGPVRTTETTLDNAALTRHSGYSGYVVKQLAGYPPDFWGTDGVTNLPDIVAKYQPDIACLMLSVNDLGYSGGWDQIIPLTRYTDDGGLVDQYETFVRALTASMDEQDIALCSSLTPVDDDEYVQNILNYNPLLKERVDELIEEGLPVEFNDNYSAVDRATQVSTDNIHLNAAGYTAVANQYATMIEKIYNADSTKKTFAVTLPSETGCTAEFETGSESPVLYNGKVSFTVEPDTGYSDSTLVVKANGVTLTPTNGVYTVSKITAAQTITVEGVELNQYAVTLPTGTGYTAAFETGSASPVNHGGSVSFKVTPDTAYNQSTVVVKVGGTPITPVSGVYTISNITASPTITVEGLVKNTYAVTLPTGTGYTAAFETGSASPVEHGGSVSFKVTPDASYNQSTPVVKVGGVEITPTNGVYTISDITAAQNVTVEGITKNTYAVTLPTGTGFTAAFEAGSASPVEHGGSVSFKVTPSAAYSEATPVVKVGGVEITPVGGVYTISNITSSPTITVDGLGKNTYAVTLPTGANYTAAFEAGSASPVEHGGSVSFKVTPDAAYSQSALVVKAGSTEITPVNGVYTISNITEAKTVTVDGLTLNKYAVTLPTGAGFTAAFEPGSESPVDHGDSVSFSLTIDEAYDKSAPVVKVNGVAITPVGGVYTISTLTGVPKITVEGVEVNKLPVLEGEDVEYTLGDAGTKVTRVDEVPGKFIGLLIDNALVDPSCYVITEGSTIITLTNEYLNTLAVGEYDMEAVFTSGSAYSTLTILAKENTTPNTGDGIFFVLAAFAVSAAVCVVAVKQRSKVR